MKVPSKLGRKRDHRNRLIANLATSLILYGQIKTTHAKAKSIQPYVERIFSIARKNDLASKRFVARNLSDPKAISKIFDIAIPNLKTITSGFTSLIKANERTSDGASMSIILIRPEIFAVNKVDTSKTIPKKPKTDIKESK